MSQSLRHPLLPHRTQPPRHGRLRLRRRRRKPSTRNNRHFSKKIAEHPLLRLKNRVRHTHRARAVDRKPPDRKPQVSVLRFRTVRSSDRHHVQLPSSSLHVLRMAVHRKDRAVRPKRTRPICLLSSPFLLPPLRWAS